MNLEVSFSPGGAPSPLDIFDPRARLLCALALSFALSALGTPALLLYAALIPLALIPCGAVQPLLLTLLRLNAAGLIMALFLALTYPGAALWGPFSREGVRMGLTVLLRLNLIMIVLLRLAAAMGPERTDAALTRLGLPEKLRVLLLLTLRGIFLLSERFASALRAVRLRAPHLQGTLKLKAFACVAASALLQASDRSERMAAALRCRGGLSGFHQTPHLVWRRRDTVLCLFFMGDIAALAWLALRGAS
ncbi:MAG: energy-coupling factor transporter transmembrane protein EcfT [Fretibacterium sp.]|nr:energy-coupling factor transporter transmembrane protein EcfT [Fretibacterium sp.]